jgi:GAF domain-containing protein
VTGALNIYRVDVKAFDGDTIILAQTFSGYAAVALADVHLYDAVTTLVQHMQTAMESRAVIEQAKGIVMGRRRRTADEAFALLANCRRAQPQTARRRKGTRRPRAGEVVVDG